MSEPALFRLLVLVELALAVVTGGAVSRIVAPYGRHTRPGFGPGLPVRWAWVVMESPSALGFAVVFAAGPHAGEPAPLLLAALWLAHYLQRAFIYPFTTRVDQSRRMPVVLVSMGFAFNAMNAYLNARWLSRFAEYPRGWLVDPRLLVGVALFVAGFAMNRWADAVLRRLRKPGDIRYRIPRGGLYEFISCPNYAGELLEWIGWAIAAWSPAGAAFAAFTAANLVPRALAHHHWYGETFPAYPARRKAIVPFIL